MAFKKAEKSRAFLRLAMYSLSGGGKTYTALKIARGISEGCKDIGNGRIAVVDTEFGSASKYSDLFDFDVSELSGAMDSNGNLNGQNPDDYVREITAAAQAGYPVLILDSLSHGWEALCAQVEQLAKAKYRGNTWSAWSEGTPEQKRLINAILGYPGHIIATMRAKTEWSLDKDKDGKSKPSKIGLAPQQRGGIEYEFDMVMSLNAEHFLTVEKDRTGRFQGREILKPDEGFGRELYAWLMSGKSPVPAINDALRASRTVQELKASIHRYDGVIRGLPDSEKASIKKEYEVNLARLSDTGGKPPASPGNGGNGRKAGTETPSAPSAPAETQPGGETTPAETQPEQTPGTAPAKPEQTSGTAPAQPEPVQQPKQAPATDKDGNPALFAEKGHLMGAPDTDANPFKAGTEDSDWLKPGRKVGIKLKKDGPVIMIGTVVKGPHDFKGELCITIKEIRSPVKVSDCVETE